MSRNVTLLTAATTAAAPTLVSHGVAFGRTVDEATILVNSTAGSGTMTAALRLWGWNPDAGRWYGLPALNGGTAIPEFTADLISYGQTLTDLRAFSRIACEIVTLGGTATAVTVLACMTKATPAP